MLRLRLLALVLALASPASHGQYVAEKEGEEGQRPSRDAVQIAAKRATDKFLATHVVQPGSFTRPLLRNFHPPPHQPTLPPVAPDLPRMPAQPPKPHHPHPPPPPEQPPVPPMPNVEELISKQQKVVDAVVTRRKLHISVTLYWDSVSLNKKSLKYAHDGMAAWDTFLKGHAKQDVYLTYEKRESGHYKPSDLAIYWGGYNKNDPKSDYRRYIWTSQLAQNRHVLVMDAGFFRRDLGFYSLSFDTGHDPDACGVQSPYSGVRKDMWAVNYTNFRWVHLGEAIYPPHDMMEDYSVTVFGQIPWDTGMQLVHNYNEWLHLNFQLLQMRQNRTIFYRPHPLTVAKPVDKGLCYTDETRSETAPCIPSEWGLEEVFYSYHTLDRALLHTAVAVGYSSNVLLQAVIAGVPVINLSPCTPTDTINRYHELTREALERTHDPSETERRQLLYNLANYQYDLREIAKGHAWKWVLNRYDLKNVVKYGVDGFRR